MWAYLTRRLLLSTLAVFGVLVITFFLSHVIPGDPIAAILGPQAPDHVIEDLRRRWGLDRPIPEQFVRYLSLLARGDLGRSIATNRPVLDDLREFFPATVELATAAILVGVTLGMAVGIVSAVARGRWVDHVVRFVSLIGLSMPVFWLGLIALLVFYFWAGVLPGPGQLDILISRPPRVTGLILVDSVLARDGVALRNALAHMVLPALVLGSHTLVGIARITRASMLEVLGQEYIKAARAKGLAERTVILRHALKNALLPIVTVIGIYYGSLLEGAVLTETVFAWPGLGRYATSAILSQDFAAVMGVTLLIALIFSLANLVVDLLYAALNPRIRYE
ncbi:MAG: ABC transporter permease [Armatimonadota bacterium]|nr:ABC transporter permease [Armatimonadota bacterium]MDR7401015.1 ABC transporter permease [Armatimonadota bacterium]MDR7403223.1 ABC transporter permease [Armatimonadota bacterium]MDR7436726.1 ABC transporter permease [Armatimonadota bacterium]MDR7471202.1 ABC transporter permease [Armatimonadota bacterium]